MARHPLPIDANQVYKLARLGCTQAEIADILGCSTDTLQRRFAVEMARARASLRMSIRRAQVVRATRDRSDTMLVWLGKVELGQTDKSEIAITAYDDDDIDIDDAELDGHSIQRARALTQKAAREAQSGRPGGAGVEGGVDVGAAPGSPERSADAGGVGSDQAPADHDAPEARQE